MADAFVSPEPVAYCIETPLHGWEIASPARAAAEPELRWWKLVALTDAEREALRCAAATCRGVGRAVRSWPENQWADIIDALLERHARGGGA